MSLLSIDSINPDQQLSAAIAIYFARLALPVWQQRYPEDSRPEKTIEAAEKALFTAASTSAVAANADAWADDDAANADAAAAYAANYAASNANHAACALANADAVLANAHVDAAAANAANALGKDKESFVHHHLVELLPIILWHKLISKRSFGEPEKVFELLPEACREDFLFNLDSLM